MEGFVIFDDVHLTWLFVITTCIIYATIMYKRSSHKQQILFQRIVFWLLLLLELAKQLYLVLTHQYTAWSPPLHLCGLGIFIIGWHAYWPNRPNATILFALTLPGAVIALIFPGWTVDPVGSFLHIHSFIFHMLLVLYVVALLLEDQLEIRVKDLWCAIVFLIIIVPVIYIYNNRFQTNFMFLNRPVRGTPLQALHDAFGDSGYIASLVMVLFVVWIIQYCSLFLLKKKPWQK